MRKSNRTTRRAQGQGGESRSLRTPFRLRVGDKVIAVSVRPQRAIRAKRRLGGVFTDEPVTE